MYWIDTTILIGSVLLLIAVLSIKFSSRLGMPVLVAFLGLGMLAGSDGIGGIEFENFSLSYAIGTFVLAVILYSGGLSTPSSAIRYAWKPAGMLATVGVFITSAVTGLAAAWILDFPIRLGLLLGSIVGSTDASAVFSILKSGGIHIRRSLGDTLELESGSNDPMAIFLMIGLVEYLAGSLTNAGSAVFLLFNQLLVGLLIGVLIGHVAVWMMNRVHLEVAGLYPILAMTFGLISYGLAADLGGSGFLSIYVTGIVVGNRRVPFDPAIQSFHDAMAWLGQIIMFILLGMLSFPSRLGPVLLPGLAIAIVLMFVARPLAVYACLMRSRFSNREKLFLSWVGLKGAVPITLAIYPLMMNIEGAAMIFDVVFFIVIISAVLQGSTLKPVAQWLDLDVPPKRVPPITLEISSLHEVDADIVDYFIDKDTQVAGKYIRDLALPQEVVIALVMRQNHSLLPRGSFRIEEGDHLIIVVNRKVRKIVDRIFSRTLSETHKISDWPVRLEFPLRGTVCLGDLFEYYSIQLDQPPETTLQQWIKAKAAASGQRLVIGLVFESSGASFRILELGQKNEVLLVGLTFLPEQFAIASSETATEPNETSCEKESAAARLETSQTTVPLTIEIHKQRMENIKDEPDTNTD